MRTIVHLSDLHFGKLNKAVIDPLINTIKAVSPDVIVISGDLTMRATKKEFIQTQHFLGQLKFPKIIVPGNHDIPLYNVYSRFFRALKKYKHYVTEDLQPVHQDGEIAVFGINTARSFQIMRGQADSERVERICQDMQKLPEETVRIIVSHHPFDLPGKLKKVYLVKRSRESLEKLIKSKTDIFMAGHVHASVITHIPKECEKIGYNSLVVQAGTATSRRTRKEQNAFNILRLNYPNLTVSSYIWDLDKGNFLEHKIKNFTHSDAGWKVN